MDFFKKLSMAFAAGSLGGLCSFIAFWAGVSYGVTAYLGVTLPLSHSGELLTLLYHYLVLGGTWGLLFALPIMEKSDWWKRALFIGLLPTLVALFYLFPFVDSAGLMGKEYGTFTFVVVLVINWIWALIAAAWYEGVG